jgi:hypothetical protein
MVMNIKSIEDGFPDIVDNKMPHERIVSGDINLPL